MPAPKGGGGCFKFIISCLKDEKPICLDVVWKPEKHCSVTIIQGDLDGSTDGRTELELNPRHMRFLEYHPSWSHHRVFVYVHKKREGWEEESVQGYSAQHGDRIILPSTLLRVTLLEAPESSSSQQEGLCFCVILRTSLRFRLRAYAPLTSAIVH